MYSKKSQQSIDTASYYNSCSSRFLSLTSQTGWLPHLTIARTTVIFIVSAGHVIFQIEQIWAAAWGEGILLLLLVAATEFVIIAGHRR